MPPHSIAHIQTVILFDPFVAYIADIFLHLLEQRLLKIKNFRFPGHDNFPLEIITPKYPNCKNKVSESREFALATMPDLRQNRIKGGVL